MSFSKIEHRASSKSLAFIKPSSSFWINETYKLSLSLTKFEALIVYLNCYSRSIYYRNSLHSWLSDSKLSSCCCSISVSSSTFCSILMVAGHLASYKNLILASSAFSRICLISRELSSRLSYNFLISS